MSRAKRYQNSFPEALKVARSACGLSQEAFSLASSRTYVSSLERGLKTPTLKKVDELAEVLDIHPLTLLTLSYVDDTDPGVAAALLSQVSLELSKLSRQRKK